MSDSVLTGAIDHVGVSVSDFDGMVQWYKDAFGLHENESERLYVEDGIKVALLSGPDGFRLEIMSRPGSERGGRHEGPVEQLLSQGYHHWAFMVTDLDAAFSRLTAAGATVAYPKHEIREISVKYGYVTDPEGNMIELVQPVVFDDVEEPAAGTWRRLRWSQARESVPLASSGASVI